MQSKSSSKDRRKGSVLENLVLRQEKQKAQQEADMRRLKDILDREDETPRGIESA